MSRVQPSDLTWAIIHVLIPTRTCDPFLIWELHTVRERCTATAHLRTDRIRGMLFWCGNLLRKLLHSLQLWVVCSCLCKIDNVQGHQVIYVGFYQYWEPENLKRTSRHSGQAGNVNISGLIQIASCKLMCLTWYFSGGWRSGKYRPILPAIKALWFCVKMRVEDRLLLGVVVVVSGWWVWVGECICGGSGVKVFLCLAMC